MAREANKQTTNTPPTPQPSNARAHRGFCKDNLHATRRTYAPDGSPIENITCGCTNNPPVLAINHQVLLGCINAGSSIQECANQLHATTVNRLQAVTTAAAALAEIADVPPSWVVPVVSKSVLPNGCSLYQLGPTP